MYLELLDSYEKKLSEKGTINPSRHDARFEFALWLEKQAAQQGARLTGLRRCLACNALLEETSVYCDSCGTDTPRR